MKEPGWDRIVVVVCTHCRDELKIENHTFSYRIDARSDVQAFLKYCTCPNCGKKKMELSRQLPI
jgi:hypothetical protein